MLVDRDHFEKEMAAQKNRSKQAAEVETEDWVVIKEDDVEEFVGYEQLSADIFITRYRKVKSKKSELYHLVFDVTPFYAESGGQVGDKGILKNESETIRILDTRKENDLIIHVSKELPKDPSAGFTAFVDEDVRRRTANNHSATPLMHFALRKVLGENVEQKV